MPLIVEGKKITHMRESRRGLSWNVQTYQIPLVKLVTLASPLQPHLFLWTPPPSPQGKILNPHLTHESFCEHYNFLPIL